MVKQAQAKQIQPSNEAPVPTTANEVQYRFLAEAIPQLVWTTRPDGFADYVNQRWTEYTGLNLEQTQGEGWLQALHPEDRLPCLDFWSKALVQGEPFQSEYRLKKVDGTYRWHLARGVPIRTPQGGILQWIGTCTDIDEQKRAQEALREADRNKNEFLAILAHELRNPLAPISNALQVLRLGGAVTPAAEEAREVVDRQVRQIASLIDDLFDVSRISRGKVQLRKEAVDVCGAMARAVETTRPLMETRRHHLEVVLPPGTTRVMADPSRLEQILANLLNNAAKYTEPGGHIRLTCVREGNEVVFRVQDNGFGISPEMLPRIFDLYAQASDSPAQSEGGLGIGLTLVRSLVDLHGGSVTASSAGPGRGSEFVVRFPFSEEAEKSRETMVEAKLANGSSRRILVVDDNVDACETMALLMKMMGHEVHVVHDGPAALDAVDRHRPEVVFLDLGLPGLDGYEVARRLRTRHGNRFLLIAQTGYGQAEDRQRTLEAGFDMHLVKPVAPEELLKILAQQEDKSPREEGETRKT